MALALHCSGSDTCGLLYDDSLVNSLFHCSGSGTCGLLYDDSLVNSLFHCSGYKLWWLSQNILVFYFYMTWCKMTKTSHKMSDIHVLLQIKDILNSSKRMCCRLHKNNGTVSYVRAEAIYSTWLEIGSLKRSVTFSSNFPDRGIQFKFGRLSP